MRLQLIPVVLVALVAPAAAEPGGASLRRADLTVSRSADKVMVSAALDEHQFEIDMCLAAKLKTTTVAIKFRIDRTGAASNVSTTGMTATETGCVSDALKAIKFPLPSKGAIDVQEKVAIDVTQDAAAPDGAVQGGFGYGRGGLAPGASPNASGVRPDPSAPVLPTVTKNSAGKLDPAVVRRAVQRNFKQLSACYDAVRKEHPELTAVTARFTIGINGRVTMAPTGSTDAASACLAKALAQIEFPRPRGGFVEVLYPLSL